MEVKVRMIFQVRDRGTAAAEMVVADTEEQAKEGFLAYAKGNEMIHTENVVVTRVSILTSVLVVS